MCLYIGEVERVPDWMKQMKRSWWRQRRRRQTFVCWTN